MLMEKFNFHVSEKTNKHQPIIDFFKKNKFGSNNPVMTYLSVLSPIDRCVILEALFDENALNIVLSDKLLLAYITSGKQELAMKVIQNAKLNGENDFNIYGLESKLDLGLAPKRSNEERISIFNDFKIRAQDKIEFEFLDLVITFCENN